MSFNIITATRTNAPVSVYIEGESGSGKTYSALLLARGLAGPTGKIGIIDTEGGRSLIYADDPDIGGFEYMAFSAPFSPQRCIEALDAAKAAGWSVIVLDSASLEHDGEGGLLEMADMEEAALLEKNPNNRATSQQKWTRPKLAHKRFLNHAVGMPCHVIMCFRQTITTDFSAKPPVSMKTAVCEKNTRFSLELHATIDNEHRAHWSRIPKPYVSALTQDRPITVAMGALLAGAAGAGKPAGQPTTTPTNQPAKVGAAEQAVMMDDLRSKIADMINDAGIDEEAFNGALKLLTKGKVAKWETADMKTLERMATEDGFGKIRAQILSY